MPSALKNFFIGVLVFFPVVILSVSLRSFTMEDYKQCLALWKNCPQTGAFYDAQCVTTLVEQHGVCRSLGALSKKLDMPPSALSIEKVDKFYVVTKHFFADGQSQYYVLTPQGKLVDTNQDPRLIDPILARKYKGKSLVVLAATPLQYHAGPSGKSVFMIQLRIAEGCVACSTLGTAQVKFTFSARGRRINTELLTFKPTKMPNY